MMGIGVGELVVILSFIFIVIVSYKFLRARGTSPNNQESSEDKGIVCFILSEERSNEESCL